MIQRFPDILPSESSVMRRRMDVLEVRFGDGAMQRMPRFGAAAPIREWQLVFTNITAAQAVIMDEFLASHNGVTPFLWTPPRGSAGHYRCHGWEVTPATAGLAGLRALFIETGDAS